MKFKLGALVALSVVMASAAQAQQPNLNLIVGFAPGGSADSIARIVGARIKTPRGEVDLIARRGKSIAFVEVKARTKAVDLATAIDATRLRRVAAAAEILRPKYGKECENMQINVIMVAPWRWPNHLPNVWHG